MSDQGSGFYPDGGLPGESSEPEYVSLLRELLPTPGELEHVVPVRVLREWRAALEEHLTLNLGDAGAAARALRALAVPKLQGGMIKELAGHVDLSIPVASQTLLFGVMGAEARSEMVADHFELALCKANGTVGALEAIEWIASRWPKIDHNLTIDAAWDPPESAWEAGLPARPRS